MGIPYNELLTENLLPVAWLVPASKAAATYTVGGVSMAKHRRLLVVLEVGALGGGTVDAKLQTSATSGGSYADLAGSSITQVTAGASNFITIELKAEVLSTNAVGPWVRVSITVGTAAVVLSCTVWASVDRYLPVLATDGITVAQTVTL